MPTVVGGGVKARNLSQNLGRGRDVQQKTTLGMFTRLNFIDGERGISIKKARREKGEYKKKKRNIEVHTEEARFIGNRGAFATEKTEVSFQEKL